jgi:hypothetical protein
MARFRCVNCGEPPEGFYFEAARDQCPRCGKSGPVWIASLVDVHLVVMDDAGAIASPNGRQFVACQKRRDHLAAHQYERFAATDDPAAVTCPSCKGTPWWLAAAAANELIARRADAQRRLRADCCG